MEDSITLRLSNEMLKSTKSITVDNTEEKMNRSRPSKPQPLNAHGLRKMSLKPHSSVADDSLISISAGEDSKSAELR